MNVLDMVTRMYFLEGIKETDKETIVKGNFKSKEGTKKEKKSPSWAEKSDK